MAVTPENIAVALGRTAPADGTPEHDQWEMWIADALMLIEARLVGTGPGQVPSLDDLDPAKLDYVVREAVVAHIRNPDDATQVAVSVDDASTSRSYRSAKGRVTILDEWWELLAPKTNSRAFSVRPQPEAAGHAPWCNLMFPIANGTQTCSCGATLSGGDWIYEPAED
ncbi:hypothetical protein [Pimelobacter simplex]|uniref:hypothetical protein n=1 Tax=Nocardioides simplex TaxID=2045 RepID=UPI003AAE901A